MLIDQFKQNEREGAGIDTLSAIQPAIRRYLDSHNVLCLATAQDNQPWVAPVFYSVFKTGLVFLSAPHTRHCKNIAANPNVSASVQEDYNDWNDIKGIQLEGKAMLVPDFSRAAVVECYAQKFPVTGHKAPPAIARALDKILWFEVRVDNLYYIDNSKGLGHREEVDPISLFES